MKCWILLCLWQCFREERYWFPRAAPWTLRKFSPHSDIRGIHSEGCLGKVMGDVEGWPERVRPWRMWKQLDIPGTTARILPCRRWPRRTEEEPESGRSEERNAWSNWAFPNHVGVANVRVREMKRIKSRISATKRLAENILYCILSFLNHKSHTQIRKYNPVESVRPH